MRSWKTGSVRTRYLAHMCAHVRRLTYRFLSLLLDELESMLKDQNSPGASKSQSSLSSPSVSVQSQSPSLPVYSGATNTVLSTPPPTFHSPSLGLPQSYQSSSAFAGVAPPSKGFTSPVDTQPEAVNVSTTASAQPGVPSDTSFLSHSFGYDVFWPGWPRDLPSPGLVRHL